MKEYAHIKINEIEKIRDYFNHDAENMLWIDEIIKEEGDPQLEISLRLDSDTGEIEYVSYVLKDAAQELNEPIPETEDDVAGVIQWLLPEKYSDVKEVLNGPSGKMKIYFRCPNDIRIAVPGQPTMQAYLSAHTEAE